MNALQLQEVETIGHDNSGFRVTDLQSANWAFRKMSALQAEIDEKKKLAALEIDRIKQWLEEETKASESSISYFNSLVEGYYREQRENDPKYRLKTPYGTVSSRKQQPEYKYTDVCISSLKNVGMEELVNTKVTETVDKKAVKDKIKEGTLIVKDEMLITSDGEVVEGVSVLDREDTITVKVV